MEGAERTHVVRFVENMLFRMAFQSKVYSDLVSINLSNILAHAMLVYCFPPTDSPYLNMFIPIAAASQDELVKALLVTEVGNLYHAVYTFWICRYAFMI
jgi:hypothetical protein